jgi:ParB family chromosome partitioning protein
MTKTHNLKLDPVIFDEVLAGRKTFEYRINDRDYQPGDLIHLEEFDRATQKYSGRALTFDAGFILYGPDYGLPAGTCIISIIPDIL